MQRTVCCCRTCQTMTLKLKALNLQCTRLGLSEYKITSQIELSDMNLCKYREEYASMACIQRNCNHYGAEKVQKYYEKLFEKEINTSIKYEMW